MSKPMLYRRESEDLETHVSLCHERYLQLDARMSNIESDVGEIKRDLHQGNKQLKVTIITTAGTILTALIAVMITVISQNS